MIIYLLLTATVGGVGFLSGYWLGQRESEQAALQRHNQRVRVRQAHLQAQIPQGAPPYVGKARIKPTSRDQTQIDLDDFS